MNKGRQFGRNLRYFMSQRGVGMPELAQKTGYQEIELLKIIDGRLYVSPKEKKEFSSVLSVPEEQLMRENDNILTEDCGYMEFRGRFSNMESMEKILDMFDAYCDIQEVLLHERMTSQNDL